MSRWPRNRRNPQESAEATAYEPEEHEIDYPLLLTWGKITVIVGKMDKQLIPTKEVLEVTVVP